MQYAGEASGLKYAVAVRGVDEPPTRPRPVSETPSTAAPAVEPDLGAPSATDTARWAAAVHAAMEDPARSVLVGVDPSARAVRIVTGARSGNRLPDAGVGAIAESMAFLFATRGLVPGLVAGLQQLGQLAGPPPPRRPAPGRDSSGTTVPSALERDAG